MLQLRASQELDLGPGADLPARDDLLRSVVACGGAGWRSDWSTASLALRERDGRVCALIEVDVSTLARSAGVAAIPVCALLTLMGCGVSLSGIGVVVSYLAIVFGTRFSAFARLRRAIRRGLALAKKSGARLPRARVVS